MTFTTFFGIFEQGNQSRSLTEETHLSRAAASSEANIFCRNENHKDFFWKRKKKKENLK